MVFLAFQRGYFCGLGFAACDFGNNSNISSLLHPWISSHPWTELQVGIWRMGSQRCFLLSMHRNGEKKLLRFFVQFDIFVDIAVIKVNPTKRWSINLLCRMRRLHWERIGLQQSPQLLVKIHPLRLWYYMMVFNIECWRKISIWF